MTLTSDFDLFQLPGEHHELRTTLRALCEKQIAPHAADVDENARFPHEALKALTTAGFHAVHVPETYGGQGADSVATCIVIEEVARVDASAASIPAVNKLGKAWISNGGASSWYTVMAVTDASKGPNGISAFMVHKPDSRPRWPPWTTPVRPLEPKPWGLRRALWMQLSHIPRSASSLGAPSRTSKPWSLCWLTWR